jgi:hypothetical protein
VGSMTEAKGTDGTIAIDGSDVVLTFSGFATQAVKKAASPRRIPLSAIAAVELTEPKGMRTGSLRLVLAGEEGVEPPKPAVDVNAVQSNKGKSEKALAEMAENLRAIIAGANAVPTEIAGPPVDPDKKPGFVQRMQEQADAQQQALADKGVLFQGQSHESGRNSTVTLYADRLERVKAKKVTALSSAAQDVEVTPVRAVSSVQTTKDGMVYTKVTVFASGNNIEFRFGHDEARRFKDALMKLVLGGGTPVPAAAAAAQPDVMEQLRKLGELRDAGILTPEEFEAKKAQLLERL